MKTQPIETPYGRKTPELLVSAMDCYTKHQNNPIYGAAPDMFEALEEVMSSYCLQIGSHEETPEMKKARTLVGLALQKAKGGK